MAISGMVHEHISTLDHITGIVTIIGAIISARLATLCYAT